MPPDVSVIIAVYNTEAYLQACLDSLLSQTLGLDRLEIILVDDGSTDGSEIVVDDFARSHPESVKVIHQSNSGTPAAPFNRGMEVATGRYLFFLGSDDYLGIEALERLVRAGDDWDSDVVFGRNIGIGGHKVSKRVFSQGTVRDLDLFDSYLPYGLSNSKLFRRALIESLGLTYREDIRSRCDQPFTLTAIVRGKRVSVLTDYDYYYCVKRADESNVTFTTDPAQVLRSAEVIMDTIAELVEAGPRRDFVMKRQFHLEMGGLVGEKFLDFDAATQQSVVDGVAALADKYLTDNILGELAVRSRLKLALAAHRDLDGLLKANRAMKEFNEGGRMTFVVDGDRLFSRYPGFRAGKIADENFEVLDEGIARRLAQGFRTAVIRHEADRILVEAELDVIGLAPTMVLAELVPLAELAAAHSARVVKGKAGAPLPLTLTPGPDSTRITATVTPSALPGQDPALWSMRLRITLRGTTYDLPFLIPADESSMRAHKHGASGLIKVESAPEGRLVLSRTPRRSLRSVLRAPKRG